MPLPVLLRFLVGLTLLALTVTVQAELLKPMVLAYAKAGG
jgi:hypothetical protein